MSGPQPGAGVRHQRSAASRSFYATLACLVIALLSQARAQGTNAPPCTTFQGTFLGLLGDKITFSGALSGTYIYVNATTPCGVCITGDYRAAYIGSSQYDFSGSTYQCSFNVTNCGMCTAPGAFWDPMGGWIVTMDSTCSGWWSPTSYGWNTPLISTSPASCSSSGGPSGGPSGGTTSSACLLQGLVPAALGLALLLLAH